MGFNGPNLASLLMRLNGQGEVPSSSPANSPISDEEQLAANLRAYADRPQNPEPAPTYAQDAFGSQAPQAQAGGKPTSKLKSVLANFFSEMGNNFLGRNQYELERQQRTAQIDEIRARIPLIQAQAQMTQQQSQMVDVPGYGPVPLGLAKILFQNVGKTDAARISANPKFLKEGYRLNAQNEVEPIPEGELSPIQHQQIAQSRAVSDYNAARAELERAKNDPNSPLFQQAEEKYLLAANALSANLGMKREALDLRRDMMMNGLTNTTRSMVEAAPKVKELGSRVLQEIDQQVNSLGPAASRWNEFMAGKVGAPNAEFTKLRTNVGLLTTLLMRMHVGARGGEYIMKHFQDMMNSGTQSPENLKAAIGEVLRYADDVQNEGAQHGYSMAPLSPRNQTVQPVGGSYSSGNPFAPKK